MPEPQLPIARDWMTRDFLVLHPGDDIFQAIDRLLASDLSSAPVTDADGKLVGVFTEKDAVRALSRVLYEEATERPTVAAHMSTGFSMCGPDWDLFRVSELFLGSNFPGLPVVEDGKLVGIIRRKGQIRGLQEFRRRLDGWRRSHEQQAGTQADRPRGIEALQRAAGRTTREQLARLFGRRTN